MKKIFVLFMFLLIFNPPIIRGISFTMIFVFILGIVSVRNINNTKKICCNEGIKKYLVGLGLFGIYTITTGIVFAIINKETDKYIISAFSTCFYLVCAIVVAVGITNICIEKKITVKKMSDIIVMVGTIQAIIAMICLLMPNIKEFLNEWTINNSSSGVVVRAFSMNQYRRCYGFASTLFDIFGCAMSIIAIIALEKGICEKKQYLISYMMITFTAIINARTSIILVVVGSLIVILAQIKEKMGIKVFSSILLLLILVIIGIISVLFFTTNTFSENSKWIGEGISEILLMLKGEKNGYFEILFNDFLFFPDFFGCIFGTGLTPNEAIGVNSDVGYIQNIWQVGLIGSILLYSSYFGIFNHARKNTAKQYPGLFIALLVVVAIYMIKLNCLTYSMASTVFLPFIFCCIYMKSEGQCEQQIKVVYEK